MGSLFLTQPTTPRLDCKKTPGTPSGRGTPKRKEVSGEGGRREKRERKREREKALSFTGSLYTYITNWEND